MANSGKSDKEKREDRLAAELRANLRRRKQAVKKAKNNLKSRPSKD